LIGSYRNDEGLTGVVVLLENPNSVMPASMLARATAHRVPSPRDQEEANKGSQTE